MKKSAVFTISSAWWDANRPEAMTSTGLGQALRRYEAAKADLTTSVNKLAAANSALQAVDAARLAAIGKCAGPLFPDAKVVLTAGAAAIKAERTALAQAYGQKLAEKLKPVLKELEASTADVTRRFPIAQKAWKDVPRKDRVGKSADDKAQKEFEKKFKGIDELLHYIAVSASGLSTEIAEATKFISAARNTDVAGEAAAIVGAAKKASVDANSLVGDLSDELDKWANELRKVNKGYQPPNRRGNAG
jgi:hypothetical protein